MHSKRIVLALSALLMMVLACNLPASPPATQPSAPTVTPFVPQQAETPTLSPAAESPVPTSALASPTAEPSPTSHPPLPRATPTAGPLGFPVPRPWDAVWRPLPDGQHEVTILIHIGGGRPPFTVHHDLDVFQTSERDYPVVFTARGCSALIHTITVESADGQTVSHEYYIPAPWCVTPSP